MAEQLTLPITLLQSASFDTFEAGSNSELIAALQHLLKSDDEPFIYLFSEPGLGKSHLLQAVCNRATTHSLQTAYIPLKLANEFSVEILEGLEQGDLIAIDDIHFIAEREDWELGLFNLYNRCKEHHTRLVISGNKPASQLSLQLPDLRSRLSSGAAYSLVPLSDQDKLSALKARSKANGLQLPDSVGRYMLNRYPRDMRYLFNVLDKLDAASLQKQRRLTIPFLKELMPEI